jgi:hypothetical protein
VDRRFHTQTTAKLIGSFATVCCQRVKISTEQQINKNISSTKQNPDVTFSAAFSEHYLHIKQSHNEVICTAVRLSYFSVSICVFN